MKKFNISLMLITLTLFIVSISFDPILCSTVILKNLNSVAMAANNGLKGEYYDNSDLTGLKVTRTDANVNFNWGGGSPDTSIGSDTFSIRWTGTIKPRYSETYTFYMESDDGVRLWVNGKLLIDKWIPQATEVNSQPITLQSGQSYNIRIEYFENGGGATAILRWSSSSQPKEVVPLSQLFPPAELPGAGLKGEYYNNRELSNLKMMRTDANVNYNWGNGSPDALLGPDTFSVRWTGTIKPRYSETYTFYIESDDGVRLWVNGQMLIDKWIPQASEQTSLPITFKAGQNYDIRIEYFENGGGAVAVLRWSSQSQLKEVVPQSQLYPPADLPGVGVKGEYFNNTDLTGLSTTRTETNINFNWEGGAPDESIEPNTFSARWTGTIKPRYSETYTFYMESDDGVRLWVNGQLLINKWMPQASELTSMPIALKAGQNYDIQIEYFENEGGASAIFRWSSQSQSKEVVPQSQLYPPVELPGVGLKGEYYDNADFTGFRMTRIDPNVSFNWVGGSPKSTIGSDTFSVRWTGTIKAKLNDIYTFYMESDDGVRLWVDGQLLIDKWIPQASELTSLPVTLKAGQNYDIRIEYFENAGGAAAILKWSSSGLPKEVIPQSYLYPLMRSYSSITYYYNAGNQIENIRLYDGTIIYHYYDANGNLTFRTDVE